jgi:hypothetical protein
MRNVSDKICRENKQKIMLGNFLNENHAVSQIMLKNIVEP